jgi:hypothetical protein
MPFREYRWTIKLYFLEVKEYLNNPNQKRKKLDSVKIGNWFFYSNKFCLLELLHIENATTLDLATKFKI